ncbi:hypothetical protein VNI00_016814 [Paramarasmius palmivorus]|uniref:F-box domain-containing protein n=1 Tax=Paramarasmius palmivorus TaxID=297713 RepID=A0AAW0BBG6_9AGAR
MDSIVLCDNCQYDFLPKDSRPLFPILDNLNDLLRSNQLPSRTDAEKEQSYIEAEGRELARCEQEITRLHNALAKLETHRNAVAERIKRFHSWHSPIRRLPVEVLEKILGLVCAPESGGYALDFRRRGSIRAPVLALTHVSHWLRAVASASPSLWSSIRIELSYYKATEDRMIQFESLLALYLSNSKNHPLHLINLCYYHPHNASVTKVLTPHIPRVARLDLVGPETLQTLYDHLPEWLGNAPHTAPILSDIKIYCSHLDLNKLPCHQLRVLEVVDIVDASSIAPVLKHCTNLHSLILHLPDTGSTQALDTEARIEMPSLQQLSITVDRALGLSLLLRPLVLPSLSSFRLVSSKDALSLAPVTDLICRSKCHLNAFAVETQRKSSIPSAELDDFLRSCPSLSRLEANLPISGGGATKPGEFMCKLLDALASLSVSSSESDMQGIPFPSSGVVYLSIYEHGYSLDAQIVDKILRQLEARTGALNNYREKVPVLRWKWDLWFETLWERVPDVMEEFNTRIENLAKNGLMCSIRSKGPLY